MLSDTDAGPSKSILGALGQVEAEIDELDRRGVLGGTVLGPIKLAIKSAKERVVNLNVIEENLQAIHAEIIKPVTGRLETGERHAALSVRLGAIGAIVGILGIVLSVALQYYSTATSNSALRLVSQQFSQLPSKPLNEIADFSIIDLSTDFRFRTRGGLFVSYSKEGFITIESRSAAYLKAAGIRCPGSLSSQSKPGIPGCSIKINLFNIEGGGEQSLCVIGISAIDSEGLPCRSERE